jgi:hypothetical protein
MSYKTGLAWVGLASLIGACIVGSFTYRKNFLWFFETEVSFVPDLLSGIIATFAVLPLWRNGDLAPAFRGLASIIAILPLFYLAAVLANIGLGGSGLAIFKLPTVWLLMLILLLANLNIRKYAELAMIVLVFLASWNVITASQAMGFNGFLFVALSLAGVILIFDQDKLIGEFTGRV